MYLFCDQPHQYCIIPGQNLQHCISIDLHSLRLLLYIIEVNDSQNPCMTMHYCSDEKMFERLGNMIRLIIIIVEL